MVRLLRRARPAVGFVCVLLMARATTAQVVEQIGTRALGMGGAFVAVADDATASYWNPAGLATGAILSLLVERQTLARVSAQEGSDAPDVSEDGSGLIMSFGAPPLGLTYYRLRGSYVVRDGRVAGADGDRRNDRATALGSLVTHHAGVTLLQSLADRLVLATVFKYVRGVAAAQPGREGTTLDEALDHAGSLGGRATSAFDVDVGVMLSTGRARIGVVGRNLREPAFEAPDGTRLGLERHVRAGLAVLPADGLIVAADVDLTRQGVLVGKRRELALGFESSLGEAAAVRAGFRVDLEGDGAPVGSLGVSVAVLRFVWLDAQVTRGQEGREQGWGMGARVAF